MVTARERPLTSIPALAQAGLLRPSGGDDAGAVLDIAGLEAVASRFAVSLTQDVATLIDPAEASDPIARQYVPDVAELVERDGEMADPIGDEAHSPLPGLVHRYPDRVLLKLVSVCAVYCRFCFRREMVGPGGAKPLTSAEIDQALAYVRGHPAIWEVILTGGDPMMASPRRLASLTSALDGIDHVGILRLHSRMPVADPQRVTQALIQAIRGQRVTTWVMLHINHARELTQASLGAIGRLVDAGIPVLGQSVLLRGVNDHPDTLEALFRAMVRARVKPHYLHHGDLAPGTSHFRTTLSHGRQLMQTLLAKTSGLCRPSYMLDIPGGHGKVPVGPSYLEAAKGPTTETSAESWRVTDPQGKTHTYCDR